LNKPSPKKPIRRVVKIAVHLVDRMCVGTAMANVTPIANLVRRRKAVRLASRANLVSLANAVMKRAAMIRAKPNAR
jgi:hypothetical protein